MRAQDGSRLAESRVLAFAVIAALATLYAIASLVVLDGFPFSGDEYSTALQAQLFAHGDLKSAAPVHVEWLRLDHVVIDAWVRSKYPPGASALLALGESRGLAWLVTPIEGAAALTVVWLAVRRFAGKTEGLVALIIIGISPVFFYNAASFYAHTPCTMFLAVAFFAVWAWTRAPRDGWLVLAGAAIGCGFLVRPIDAVLFGIAILALRSPRAVVITAASALPFVAFNLWYQAQQFGSAFTDGYHAFAPTLHQLYGDIPDGMSLSNVVSPEQIWNHIDIYCGFAINWTAAGSVIIALFGAFAIGRDHPARPMRAFAIALIVIFAVFLLLTPQGPDDGARPRYLSILLIPLAFFTAYGFRPAGAAVAARFGTRVKNVLVACAIACSLVAAGDLFVDKVPKVWKREGLYQAAAREHLSNAVVIVRAKYPSRYARNGPYFDGVLYLSAPPTTDVATIAGAYPSKQIWEAFEGEPWRLVRIR